MVRNFALRFVFFIGLACALAGANPAHAAFTDYATLYSQVQLLLNGFTDRAKAGGQTTEGFLKMDDVKGSATSTGFKDQIPVLYGQSFITSPGGSGTASPSDYYLVIPADLSGPVLEQGAAANRPFQQATITNLRFDRGQQVVSHIDTLENVRVTFYMKTTTSITAYPEIAIIGLSYTKGSWVYGQTKTCRDFAANKNC